MRLMVKLTGQFDDALYDAFKEYEYITFLGCFDPYRSETHWVHVMDAKNTTWRVLVFEPDPFSSRKGLLDYPSNPQAWHSARMRIIVPLHQMRFINRILELRARRFGEGYDEALAMADLAHEIRDAMISYVLDGPGEDPIEDGIWIE